MNESHSTINKIIQKTIDNNKSFKNLFKQSDVNCEVQEGCKIINFDEECSNNFYNCASPYEGYVINPINRVEKNNDPDSVFDFDSLNSRLNELKNSISSPAWKSELNQQMTSIQTEFNLIETKLNDNVTTKPSPTNPSPTNPSPTNPSPTNHEPTDLNQNELILQNSNCSPQIGCKKYMSPSIQPSCSPSPERALCLEPSPGYTINNNIVSPSPSVNIPIQTSNETNNANNSTPSDDDNTTRNIIIAIVVVILLGGIGYIIMKKKKMNNKLRNYIQKKRDLKSIGASLNV